MLNKLKISVLILLFLTLGVIAGTTGKIVGTVKDKNTGEPLIGANIVVEGTNLGAATDVDGYFVIINVPPGTYSLRVFYVGYAETTIENVRVNVDRTTTQEILVSPATIEGETVTVEATRPAIEMDRTHSSAVVNSETVEMLPVTELSEVIQLQSGIVSTGGELHFRGGRAREVSYVIDGVAVNNTFSQSGGSLVQVDNNMVSELEVISGTFNAEYGQAQSGVVNIITKRPSNNFSAKIESYAGDWLSSHDDIFLGINNFNPAAERNVQFSVTGPIINDKLGFFVSGRFRHNESLQWYERRFNTVDGWRIETYRRWAETNNISNSNKIPIPDSLVTGNREQGPMSQSDYFSLQAKLSWSITPKIMLTYTGFGSFQETIGNTSRVNTFAPDNRGTSQDWRYSHFLRWQHFPSENFFYNIAASYQRDDGDFFFRKDNKVARFPGDEGIYITPFEPTTSNSIGTQFSLGGTAGFYTNAPGRNYVDKYSIQADINWQVDKLNFIKAGFSVTQNWYDIFQRGFRLTSAWGTDGDGAFPSRQIINPAGLSFDEYWNSLMLYWRYWEEINGSPRVEEVGRDEVALYDDYQNKPLEMAFYIQDKLELSSDIIVNAGVRLDYFDPNERVPINYRTEASLLGSDINLKDASPKSQLSPRLGISFPISSKGAFHASYGHFFQMPPHQRMFNEPLVSVTPIQLEGRRLGNADLEPERTVAYEIGLQQSLTDAIGLDVTAYYKDFKNLLGIEQVKTLDGVEYTRYVNRDYGVAKGITIDITKRTGQVTGGFNYTLAFANGSNSDPAELFLIQSTSSLNADDEVFADRKVAPLNWDQRHTANAFVNIVQPNNWSLGLTGFIDSGTPYSPSFLELFGLSVREYRNRALKPFRWNIDLKAKKHLKLANVESVLYLKIDNVFDHLNHEDVFTITGRADQNARTPEEQQVFETEISTEGLITPREAELNPNFFSAPRKVQFGIEFNL